MLIAVWPGKAFFPERLYCVCRFLHQEKAEIFEWIWTYHVKLTTKKGYAAIWLDIQSVPDGGQAPFKIKF